MSAQTSDEVALAIARLKEYLERQREQLAGFEFTPEQMAMSPKELLSAAARVPLAREPEPQ